ncbi:MAG: CotH kinase family protein, partial [Chthoniobacteraceae bacterium]
MNRNLRLLIVAVSLLSTLVRGNAAVVINEIMFHPLGTPAENPAQEWIEIVNTSTTDTVNVSGWKLTKGVSFTIPTTPPTPPLTPGAFLVIAADVTAFGLAHPGFTGTVVGGWTGNLASGGEQIQLNDLLGVKMSDVTYADEGDWALRGRGVLSFSHKGWSWYNDADGGGKTIELRNPALGNGSGQNWGVSTAPGGTPGAVNTLAVADVAPLIKDVKHRPEIPKTTEPIVVSCDLENETAGATATLRWRVDGAGTFNTLPMSDTDGDGDVEATIPAQPTNLTVIEWYISATDGTLTRTWPAPARTSDPGVLPETFGQVTNALVQVDNAFVASTDFTVAGAQPIYRLIMTNTERAELATIGSTNGQEDSEATMNGTFISHDGTGIKMVYNAGFRNRGLGSALGPPNNFHVGFRSDDKWNGRSSMAINCRFPHSQTLGNAIFQLVGIPPQEAAIVRVRVNGVDLTVADAALKPERMYGRYARLEGRGSEWAQRHFPNDPDGNFYRLDDHDTGGSNPPGDLGSGEFRYEGTDPAAYSDTFFKETNKELNDYSDLINLCKVVSASRTADTTAGDGSVQPKILDADYPAAVGVVLDVDEFYRFLAIDALIGNQEGGLQSGRGDDASLYRGVVDPRFKFIPHDMDSVFKMGEAFAGDPVTRPIFSYDYSFGTTTQGTGVLGLARLFSHPELLPRYYSAVLDGLNTWFNHATLDPLIDQIMTGWVPASNGASSTNDSIAEIKAFITARHANVLAQIPQGALLLTNNPAVYTLNVTAAGTAVDGNQRTNDGAANFSGTFNVAKTYSITVNGALATWSYRGASAGTWTLAVGAGGGGVLSPGLNSVVVRFWDGINGTGSILRDLTTKVLWQPASATYTNVSGTLAPSGSVVMTAPASYI